MAEEINSASSLFTRLKGYLKEAPFFCKIIELVKSLDKYVIFNIINYDYV